MDNPIQGSAISTSNDGEYDPTRLFRVTNKSNQNIYIRFSRDHLTEEQLQEWRAYQKGMDYVGRTPEEIGANRMAPEIGRLETWALTRNYCITRPLNIRVAGIPTLYHEPCVLYKSGESNIMNERQARYFRQHMVQRIEIPQIEDEKATKYQRGRVDSFQGFWEVEDYDPKVVDKAKADSEMDLNDKTQSDLFTIAKALGIRLPTNTSKERIIERINSGK